MDIGVIHVERDVNAEPAVSAHPIELGAFAQLTGLAERDDYDEDDPDHCHSYNRERGACLGTINLREDGRLKSRQKKALRFSPCTCPTCAPRNHLPSVTPRVVSF